MRNRSRTSLVAALLILPAAVFAVTGATGQGKKPAPKKPGAAPNAPNVAALVAAGKRAYDANGCAGCHAISGKGGSAGPELTKTGAKPDHTEKWFEQQVANPKSHNASSAMPAYDKLAPKDLTSLAIYLTSLGGTPKVPTGAPATSAPGPKPATYSPPDPAVVAKIEKTGAAVRQVAQTDARVEVDYHLLGPSVTDAALVPLTGAKGIYELHLGRTGITDAGLVHLKGLAGLNVLHLEETKVTDRGLANIAGLKSLTYLNLYGTAVTDTGLQTLTGLTNLQHLYVWQTKVTQAGVDALKKALPKLEIVTGVSSAPEAKAADSKPADTKKQ